MLDAAIVAVQVILMIGGALFWTFFFIGVFRGQGRNSAARKRSAPSTRNPNTEAWSKPYIVDVPDRFHGPDETKH